ETRNSTRSATTDRAAGWGWKCTPNDRRASRRRPGRSRSASSKGDARCVGMRSLAAAMHAGHRQTTPSSGEADVPSVRIAGSKALTIAATLAMGFAFSLPSTAAAQYFGRNKVQYQTFHFKRLKTPHFDIYYYPAESLAAVDAARMAERWYARHSKTLTDEFDRRSIILYANHADFEQTNVIGGFI